MQFEWDEAKRAANLDKHGVDFTIIAAFDFTSSIERVDNRRDYGEERRVLIGMIDQRLHVAVITRRKETMRLISLRKANAREVSIYEQSKT